MKPRDSERGCWRRRTSVCSPRSATRIRCTFRPAMGACSSAGWRPSRRPALSTLSVTTIPASCVWCGRVRRPAAVAPPQPPGQAVYQQNCQSCHGPDRLGADSVPALVYAAADPANNIAAGAPRFGAAAIRTVIAAGKGRMPSFPHLTPADVDALVTLLTTAPGGRGVGAGRARAPAARSGRRAGRIGAPPELIVGSGSASTRPEAPGGRGRGALPPYPDGVPQYERPDDQRVQHGRQPDCAAVHVDREVRPERAGDQVACRLRRRSRNSRPAASPARARPRVLNGVVVTASGLCSAPAATIRFARGTATPAVSCGRRVSAATSSARR